MQESIFSLSLSYGSQELFADVLVKIMVMTQSCNALPPSFSFLDNTKQFPPPNSANLRDEFWFFMDGLIFASWKATFVFLLEKKVCTILLA